jgi:hypothetical protein
VPALATDSWAAVKRRFAALIGHESRMDATHAELTAAGGADQDRVRRAQARTWHIRLRDMLEDDPDLADALRELLAGLGVTPAAGVPPAPPGSHPHRGSQAVHIGGSITGTSGEVYVGVGKVDKRRVRFFFIPADYLFRALRHAVKAHPITMTVGAAVVIAAASAGIATAGGGSGPPLASLLGTWQGTYTCAQGLTGVQIIVGTEDVRSGAAPVQLSFYPVPSNPSVPQGSATFRATLSHGTVSLTPVAWKVQPSGWTLNEWTGTLPAAGSNFFDGTVIGCATFAMHRTTAGSPPSLAAGTWTGTYACSQGETGVHLAVRASSGDGLAGTFSFYAVPSNPSVPSGSYTMTGFIDPAGVFLFPGQWISQPPGWTMVNVAMNLPTGGGTAMTGEVVGCSSLSLTKAS